jgi:hypothetical protein
MPVTEFSQADYPGKTTGNIYRTGVVPPDPPAASGVSINLIPSFSANPSPLMVGGTQPALYWTHIADMPLTTDIRDGFNGNVAAVQAPTNFDSVYIPDGNGTRFDVVFVERLGRGTDYDRKRVYLQRQAVTWGSSTVDL